MSQELIPLNITPVVKRKLWALFLLLWVLVGLGIAAFAYSVYLVWPYLQPATIHYADYLGFNWVEQPALIEIFLHLNLALWFLAMVAYFDWWLLAWCVNKLRGKNWLAAKNDKRKYLMQSFIIFLKLSCGYLAAVWLYVLLQYPLQLLYSD